MIPYETHRIIFTIGDRFAVFSWGIIFAIAWLFAGYFIYRNAKNNRDIDVNKTMQFLLIIFIGVLFGSRLFHFFGPWGYGTLIERFKAMFSPTGGWVAYGGIILGMVFGYGYARIKKINFLMYCDMLAPAILLGLFIGRFGCYIAGCCFGSETHVAWAISRFSTSIHPVQLYNAFGNLIAFIIMLELARRHRARKNYDGHLVLSAIFLYSAVRFVTEFFRGDYAADAYHFGLTFSQLISIALMAFFGAILLSKHENRKRDIAIDKKTKFSYLLVSSGGILSIISLLCIEVNFYLLLAPFALGLLMLFRGLMIYTKNTKTQKS